MPSPDDEEFTYLFEWRALHFRMNPDLDPDSVPEIAPRLPRDTSSARSSSQQKPHPHTGAAAGSGAPGPTDPSASGADDAVVPAAAPRPSVDSTSPSQPQFAPDDPDSPFTHPKAYPALGLARYLAMIQRDLLQDQYADKYDAVYVPPAPQTPQAAAELQGQIDTLLQAGCLYEALPWQCQLAIYLLRSADKGPEHPDTLHVIYDIMSTLYAQNRCSQVVVMYAWLLPSVAKQLGLGHPITRQLTVWGALALYDSEEAHTVPHLARVVYNVARHLPGGLGWGTAAVAPMPDEQAYHRHVVLQGQGEQVLMAHMATASAGGDDAQKQLAVQQLQRCVAFYESVGQHWLCTPRLLHTKRLLQLANPVDVVKTTAQARREAQRLVGPGHKLTLEITW